MSLVLFSVAVLILGILEGQGKRHSEAPPTRLGTSKTQPSDDTSEEQEQTQDEDEARYLRAPETEDAPLLAGRVAPSRPEWSRPDDDGDENQDETDLTLFFSAHHDPRYSLEHLPEPEAPDLNDLMPGWGRRMSGETD